MDQQLTKLNEQQAAMAFNAQSVYFDELYKANTIIEYKRRRVREHMLPLLEKDSNILELNAGTGDDAIFFARHNFTIHATDVSSGMLEQLERKVIQKYLQKKVTSELCSFTSLDQ